MCLILLEESVVTIITMVVNYFVERTFLHSLSYIYFNRTINRFQQDKLSWNESRGDFNHSSEHWQIT